MVSKLSKRLKSSFLFLVQWAGIAKIIQLLRGGIYSSTNKTWSDDGSRGAIAHTRSPRFPFASAPCVTIQGSGSTTRFAPTICRGGSRKEKNTDLTVQRISQPKERNEQIKRQNHRGHRSARQFNAPSHASTAFQRFTFSISRESLLKASL